MDESSSRVQEFVRKYRSLGYSDAGVREALRRNGISEKVIAEFFPKQKILKNKVLPPLEKKNEKVSVSKQEHLEKAAVVQIIPEQKSAVVQKSFLSQKIIFFISTFLLIVFIILVLVFLVQFPQSGCSSDALCPDGYSCSQGTCVAAVGALDCQKIENCTGDLSCYKCVQPSLKE